MVSTFNDGIVLKNGIDHTKDVKYSASILKIGRAGKRFLRKLSTWTSGQHFTNCQSLSSKYEKHFSSVNISIQGENSQ